MQKVKVLQDLKNMVDSNNIKNIYIKKLEHRLKGISEWFKIYRPDIDLKQFDEGA